MTKIATAVANIAHALPVNPAQLKVFLTYAFAAAYPHLAANTRAALVGVVTSVYIAAYTVERKGRPARADNVPVHTDPPPPPAKAPVGTGSPATLTEVKPNV